MSYNIGDYITATLPSVVDGEGNNLHIIGTIVDVEEDGKLILNSGAVVYPEHAQITVHGDNVVSIFVSSEQKRMEAMRRHPAGKGLNYDFNA